MSKYILVSVLDWAPWHEDLWESEVRATNFNAVLHAYTSKWDISTCQGKISYEEQGGPKDLTGKCGAENLLLLSSTEPQYLCRCAPAVVTV